jgi:class 3 adenylate cyclase
VVSFKARREVATDTRIADALDEVPVLFVDMEGFTEQAVRTPPDLLVRALDALFTRFDAVADQLSDRYALGPVITIHLKGKGATAARFLFGRRDDVVW